MGFSDAAMDAVGGEGDHIDYLHTPTWHDSGGSGIGVGAYGHA